MVITSAWSKARPSRLVEPTPEGGTTAACNKSKTNTTLAYKPRMSWATKDTLRTCNALKCCSSVRAQSIACVSCCSTTRISLADGLMVPECDCLQQTAGLNNQNASCKNRPRVNGKLNKELNCRTTRNSLSGQSKTRLQPQANPFVISHPI